MKSFSMLYMRFINLHCFYEMLLILIYKITLSERHDLTFLGFFSIVTIFNYFRIQSRYVTPPLKFEITCDLLARKNLSNIVFPISLTHFVIDPKLSISKLNCKMFYLIGSNKTFYPLVSINLEIKTLCGRKTTQVTAAFYDTDDCFKFTKYLVILHGCKS